MAQRLELQALFVEILGSKNVYFQPPPDEKMEYPCIRYERSKIQTDHADNTPYSTMKRYQVTVIDEDPDGKIADKVVMLPYCSHDRTFAVDSLNHDVFTLFF